MRARAGCVGLASAALATVGCHDTAAVIPRPILVAASAHSNALNALSAIVTFVVQRADSARVVCTAKAGGDVMATPYHSVADGPDSIPVLGLLPSTRYGCVALAAGAGGAASSDSVFYETAPMPAELAGVRLEISGSPPPGYVITEVVRQGSVYTVAFDSAGRVRWYRGFAAQPGDLAMETEQLPTGNFTVYVGASTGAQPVEGRYVEFRPTGEIVRQYAADAPYYTDSHELLLSFTGGAMTAAQLYGYDIRSMDLSTLGGRDRQPVSGHILLRQSSSGATEFRWNAWDHFTLADWLFIPANLAGYANIDFDHPNSLALDTDGNYIVSFAGFGEITKIDARTGQILWRLGGRHNQFSIVNDPLGGFGFQHDVRVLANGNLLLFDNGLLHTPPQSRAVEYRLDLSAMTATLTWEYRHDPPLFNPFVGSAQRFENGNTLVGYGALDRMTEAEPGGRAIWEGRVTVDGLAVPFFYRARRIASLYRYQPL